MNRTFFVLLCIGSVALMQLGCNQNVAGRDTGGSETVNTFAVVTTDKKPVSGVSIRIVAGNTWLEKVVKNEDPTIFSDKTDARGIIEIDYDSIEATDINLCADFGEVAAYIPSVILGEEKKDVMDTIVLRNASVVSGSVSTDESYPSRVFLQGTDYSADVDQGTGAYSIYGVPAGDYHLIAVKDTGSISGAGMVEVAAGEVVELNVETDFSGVLVDDFDVQANLMSYFRIGNWYLTRGGDVTVRFPVSDNPDSSHIPYMTALATDGARSGKSLHINYTVESADFYLIAGAKVSTRQCGFSHIDTITFYARGDGILTVRLHGDEDLDKPQAFAYALLEDEWKQFSITSDRYEIRDPRNQSATWDDVKGRMTWLSFLPGADGSDFWLDDVRLKNVGMRDLIVP